MRKIPHYTTALRGVCPPQKIEIAGVFKGAELDKSCVPSKTVDLATMACASTDLAPKRTLTVHPECAALPLADVDADVLRADPHGVTAIYDPSLSSSGMGELAQAA